MKKSSVFYFFLLVFGIFFGFGCVEPTEFIDLRATASAKDIPLSRLGRINVTAASDMPEDGIVLANSTGVGVASFNLQTTFEPMVLTDFCLESVGGNSEAINSVTVIFINREGYTETATNYITDDFVCFSDVEIPVPFRRSARLYISIETASSWFSFSGDTIRLNWSDHDVESFGVRTGRAYDHRAVTDSVEGSTMIWHKTKPTISLNSGSPVGLGVPGFDDVLRFNMAADARGYVGFQWGEFSLVTHDYAGSGWNTCANLGDYEKWALYSTDDMSSDLVESLVFIASDGSNCEDSPDLVLSLVIVTLIETEEVAAGSTITYVLRGDTIDASSFDDDTIQVTFANLGWQDDSSSEEFDGTHIHTLPLEGNEIYY